MEWPNLQSYVTYVITWLHYKFISALPQYLCPPKLSVVTYGWKIPPNKSCDLLITRSRDKWKLPFHNTWSLQIWQSIYWSLEDTSHQVMWSFDHVVTWKIKKKVSVFQQHLWHPNLAEQRLKVEDKISQVTWKFSQVVTQSLFVRCS